MAPTYKVEELLAVRGSVSESAVSLEKFADEDAIKASAEHVLRHSASASRVGNKSENTAPTSTPRSPVKASLLAATPKLPAFTNNSHKGPSPSPSVKKAKAERLLKEHGSPPGRRVTAGGRIVPTDWTWSGNHAPPYGRFAPYSQYQRPWNNFFPSVQQLTEFPNGFVGYDLTGRLCQIVDGEMRELRDGHLFMATPNIPFPVVNGFARNNIANGVGRSFSQPSPSDLMFDGLLGLDKMPYDKQMQHLDGEMKKFKIEHNQIERKEVMQEHHMTPLDKEVLVNVKRDLINKMDHIRRIKKGLEQVQAGMNMPTPEFQGNDQPLYNPKFTGDSYAPSMPSAANMNGFYAPSAGPSLPNSATSTAFVNGWRPAPIAEPATSMSSYILSAPSFGPSESHSTHADYSAGSATNGLSASPDSANGRQAKRSHAVEIKAPPEASSKPPTRTGLDPTSPTYEPIHIFVPPSPPLVRSPALHPATQNTWLSNTDASDSSVSTTNFFPNDAAEHSQRKHAFAGPANAPLGAEKSAFSGHTHNTTPQKDWVRNAQIASQGTSPEASGSFKPLPVSPVETRISSWTRDILPSLEAASTQHSPEIARPAGGVNGLKALTNTPVRSSAQNTPTHHASVLNGKSEDWVHGYMFARSTRSSDSQPDTETTVEFKAGFYQGLADNKNKESFSTLTTPERGVSAQSSAHSLRKTTSNTNMFNVAAMNDSAVNLSPIAENLRSGSGHPYVNGGTFYSSNNMGGQMTTNAYPVRLASTQAFNGSSNDYPRALFNGGSLQVNVSPTKRNTSHRGYSESAVGNLQVQTLPMVDNDATPFLWKEQHLRQQQVSSILKPLGPIARSGNQVAHGERVSSGAYNSQRYYPNLKTLPLRNEARVLDPIGTKRRPENLARFDGASDDLAELDTNSFAATQPGPLKNIKKTPSPSKDAVTVTEDISQSKNSSPKKNNSSPSKAKEVRDRVTNKVGRIIKGNDQPKVRVEPPEMDPATRDRHRSNWRKRFDKMKKEDREEVRKNREDRNKH